MRRSLVRITFAVTALLATVSAVACGDDETTDDLGGPRDGGVAPIPRTTHAPGRDAQASMANMRLAHLAPDLGPVDFCYRAARTGAFTGPVLKSEAATLSDAGADADASDVDPDELAPESDADAGPLASATFRTVSKYLTLGTAGPITIAIVAGGALSCSNALVTGDVTLDPGKLSTVALLGRVGDGNADLAITGFTDDRSTVADAIRMRVIHAAVGNVAAPPAGALAVRAVDARTTVLADRVEPRRAAAPSAGAAVDALGYVTAAPVSPPTILEIEPLAADDGGAGAPIWRSEALDLELRGGSLHTAFVLSGETATSFEVLWCADTTISGDQTACRRVR